MAPAPASNVGCVLVLGESEALSEAFIRRLRAAGHQAQAAMSLTDAEVKEVLEQGDWMAAAIVTRDDALALRLTLLCAHVRPELPLWTTMFDRTTVAQLRAAVPTARIRSPADRAADALADACLAAGVRPRPRWTAGIRVVDNSLRLLVAAGSGLVAVFVAQIVISLIALRENAIDAVYFSARMLATVTDSPHAATAATWFKVVATINTVLAIGLLAMFTAGLVRVASRLRLTTAFGRRSAPARDHVIVVGFGQVGMRLAQTLRDRSVPVLAVERAFEAPAVRLAPRAGLPVAIGRGDDRSMLELLGVHRCAAVAAVTSDDLTNVAVGLAANDLVPGLPLVLRLGDGDVASETDSLLHLGQICDVHDIVAEQLAEEIVASSARQF